MTEFLSFGGLFMSIGGVAIYTGRLIGEVKTEITHLVSTVTELKLESREDSKEAHVLGERVAKLEAKVNQ